MEKEKRIPYGSMAKKSGTGYIEFQKSKPQEKEKSNREGVFKDNLQ